MLKPVLAAAALLLAALAAPAQAAPPPPDERGASAEARQRHQETIEFWTVERVRQAVPRDFVLDPATGQAQGPQDRAKGGSGKGKPGDGGDSGDGGTGDTSTAITGASWETGGIPAEATGKVLFRMGGSYYVCSATALEDGVEGTTVVTAAHCVYDNDAGAKAFADMWMFVPNYDASPQPLDAAGRFCESTLRGCWTPAALLVPDAFAGADGFQASVLPYDFAFARLDAGGKSGTDELEDVITDLPAPLFDLQGEGTELAAFGYPSAKRYSGSDLIYCQGPIGFDGRVGGTTYRLGCDMTGGSSGGGWWQDLGNGPGITSVNSYGYRGDSSMYGPKFGAAALQVFEATNANATGDTVVDLGQS